MRRWLVLMGQLGRPRKFIIRAYRKAGLPRPSANQIEDTMAVAVLTYIKRVYASARAQDD